MHYKYSKQKNMDFFLNYMDINNFNIFYIYWWENKTILTFVMYFHVTQ